MASQRSGLAAEKLPAFPFLHLGHARTEKSIALLTRPARGGAWDGVRALWARRSPTAIPKCRKAGPAELTFRHGEGEFPMMEVPDSLCVVLIGSQAQLKGLSCAIPSRGRWAVSGISQQKEGVGAVVEAVIHFWTTGEPGYIILLAWFLSDFIGFANMSCFSPGKLLRLARGTVTVPCVFPSRSHPPLESEQDACSWGSGEELALLLEPGRRWCAKVAGSPWKPSTRTTDGQNQGRSQLVLE